MAIQQTITFTKSDGAFANYTEAQADINSAVTETSQKTALEAARTAGDFTVVAEFDPINQQVTYVRTWDEDGYNAYKASHTTTGNANKTALEASGWTVTEAVATV